MRGGGVSLLFPPQLTFWQALQGGLIEPKSSASYIHWLHGLPCAVSNTRKDITVHHIVGHGLKAKGGKTSDFLAIPLTAELHLPNYKTGLHCVGSVAWELAHGSQLIYSLQTLTRALHEGVLVFKKA